MKRFFYWLTLFLSLGVAQAQVKISQLPTANTLTGLELVPIVQNGQTVITTPAAIRGYIESETNTFSAAQTFSALATFSAGAIISSGNLTVSSGTATFGGLVTAQNGLTVSSGATSLQATTVANGLTVSGGNTAFNGTGNVDFANSGTYFSSALSENTSLGTSTTGVSVGSGNGTTPTILLISGAAAANNHYWDIYADGTSLYGRVVNDAITTAQNWFDVTRSGATVSSVNFPNGTVEVAGYPLLAFAEILTTGSSCSVNSVYDSLNISSCSRTATGSYGITFGITFPLKPTCSVSGANGSTPGIISQGASSQTGTSIYAMNTSGTLVDGLAFNISCH